MKNKNQKDRQLQYRPDIDGLRAIAVLSVVGFHAFPSLVRGGFIGVDIFFVISGYLITTIIFSHLENDDFSVVDFYNKRIRRIFPALLTVFTSSFIFGWFFLLSDEYAQLGKHIFGGSSFLSNFLLYKESGYFDDLAETKPMLHLWSLAIEEQFYIIWPIFLILVWKYRLSFFRITLFLWIISFVSNIYLVQHNPVAAFYWPFPRFWELMVGCLLVFILQHNIKFINKFKNAQSLVGFSLIRI